LVPLAKSHLGMLILALLALIGGIPVFYAWPLLIFVAQAFFHFFTGEASSQQIDLTSVRLVGETLLLVGYVLLLKFVITRV
jgi:hypothetical protein